MEGKDVNVGKFVGRHLSQVKLLTRVLEHELDAAKGGREVTVDRHLIENVLDTLEIFIEDCEGATGGGRSDRQKMEQKSPTVARLN